MKWFKVTKEDLLNTCPVRRIDVPVAGLSWDHMVTCSESGFIETTGVFFHAFADDAYMEWFHETLANLPSYMKGEE